MPSSLCHNNLSCRCYKNTESTEHNYWSEIVGVLSVYDRTANIIKQNLRIKVKNSGLVKLQFVADPPDGDLYIAESRKSVPFDIKRVYYINNLGNSKAIRGKHAHKKLEQVIFCINGSFTLNLDDGKNKQSIVLNNPSYGIRLGPKLWRTMTDFSENCVILVLASDFFDEYEYIRDYDEFLKYVNND